MKLENIALITDNDQIAHFFEIEMRMLPYRLYRYHTAAELSKPYDCIIVDNDTVIESIVGYSCVMVNVSSYFEGINISSCFCTLPWPMPIGAIETIFRSIELEKLQVISKDSNAIFNNMIYITDPDTNAIMIENLHLRLTPGEFAVLDALCSAGGELVERDSILSILGASDGNIADVYVCHLRKKLESPLGRKLIFAIRGKGYRTVLRIKK